MSPGAESEQLLRMQFEQLMQTQPENLLSTLRALVIMNIELVKNSEDNFSRLFITYLQTLTNLLNTLHDLNPDNRYIPGLAAQIKQALLKEVQFQLAEGTDLEIIRTIFEPAYRLVNKIFYRYPDMMPLADLENAIAAHKLKQFPGTPIAR